MTQSRDERILIFARGRDGSLTGEVLAGAGLVCTVSRSADELCAEIQAGAGVLILAEETLTLANVTRVVGCLEGQPAWSDLPVIVVAGNAGRIGRALKALDVMGNVSVLPRPLPIDTLVTAVQSSLRARRRQYQVRNLLHDREEADRRKDEFLAMLSHELRNPLAPIRTAAQVLRFLDVPDPDVAEAREVIDRQVGHMARLIDDLLDVSRISRGKIELQWQTIDLARVVDQAAAAARPLMEAKGHELEVSLPADPVKIEGDPTRLEQVIGNVLNNAAKYTPPGGRVSVLLETEAETGVVRIRDTGIGVDPALLPRIFDLFMQGDRSLDRKDGGLGIGLTVVKSLVEQHGGTVAACSRGLEAGTEFILRFPLAAPQARSESTPAAALPHLGRVFRVLIVEDNADAARLLARLFRLQGHEVRVAHDANSAVEMARVLRPDVVVSDIGLPGTSGYELARRLRQEPPCRRALLLALTGYGHREDIARAREAGFDHHLTKPLDLKRLEAILSSLGAGPAPASPSLAAIRA